MERKRQEMTESEMESEASPSKRNRSYISLPGGEYEVFLSFSGRDTRCGFMDFLYQSLIKSGVRTFQDNEELRKGKDISHELRKAIRESRISIPIFSKNYASSKWCLMELQLTVECNKSVGQLILPIFYDVEVSEVKHQPAGSTYEEAFKKHKESGNFSDETLEQWKKALNEVGHLKGWNLKTEADGYQGKLIMEKIVPRVLSVLRTKFVDVTKNLVGMDHHENEMMKLLDSTTDDIQIIGIYGMTGIGKTTVAKFMYNKLLLGNFDCCTFLADVQEMAKNPRGLVCLQEQLLADTLNRSPFIIRNVDYGVGIIRGRLCNKKVLIVIDDVNCISHVHNLVGELGCFGKGSKIIVTTKNKGVLNALKVQWTYELPFMSAVQSFQLFSKHAFDREFPAKEFVSISRKIASNFGGLPLALKSIDLKVYGTNHKMWGYELKKFAETPIDKVLKKLRVDYEELNSRQQDIFLDIACIFLGMDKTTVFYMWEDCWFYPKTEFFELDLMSLVKVGGANELWMQNQLITLGKKVVNEQKCRSRLWNHAEALEVLEEGEGTIMVKALSLPFDLKSEEKRCFTDKEFRKLKHMRYLRVDGADLNGNFINVLFSLRWLNWRGCPSDFARLNFHMKKLVILDLSKSGINENWRVWTQIQKAKKLKVLLVAECAFTRTPKFSSDSALEILNLAGCASLEDIDPSIGNLKKLKVLDISNTNIRKLPDKLWELGRLEVLDLTECSKLAVDFPGDVEGLSSLRYLSFYGSKIQSLPSNISGLAQLQTLNIGGCTELHSLPELPSSLRILNTSCIPDLSNLVNLRELQLLECHDLVDMLTNISKLLNLEKLTLDSTKLKCLPNDIGLLSQLKVLDIRSCEDLQCILGLPSSLVELSLATCDALETLPDLANLKILSSLLLKNCDKLAQVQGLEKLESLTSLYIFACDMLATSENMPDLSHLKKLEILSISECLELDKIQGLDGLESLRYLNLCGCENLCKIEGLEALESLEVLDVLRCTSLKRIPDLPYTYIRCQDDEIADTVYSYWTELIDKKLEGLRQPVFSGYTNEATH